MGTTNQKRKLDQVALIATRNEISLQYENEKKEAVRLKKRLKKGRLSELIKMVKTKNNLAHIPITEALIRQRLKRDVTTTVNYSGISSPLAAVEPMIVSTIVQMSRIRQSLTPTQALQLINSMIEGTPVQDDFIEWKRTIGKYYNDDSKTVGRGYWRGLKKQNEHLLVSKKGKKFELNRSAW